MRVRTGLPLTAVVAVLGFAAIALAADDPPTPVITGTPRVGETLTASGGTVFKWQRCDPGTDPCAEDASQNASGWQTIATEQTYTLTLADEGMMIRVLGKDTQEGTKFAPSSRVGPIAPAPPPGEETARPIFQSTGNLEPLEGTVLFKLPGSKQWVELQEVTGVPMGTKVDVSDGHVLLITQKKPSGELQSIELWAGAFALQQRRKDNITVLSLANGFTGAVQSRAGAETARLLRKNRKLWGRGKCRCKHRGRNSSGTSRGTWWLTADGPDGTLTKVKKGKVRVRDFKRKKTVLVKAGEKYLARD